MCGDGVQNLRNVRRRAMERAVAMYVLPAQDKAMESKKRFSPMGGHVSRMCQEAVQDGCKTEKRHAGDISKISEMPVFHSHICRYGQAFRESFFSSNKKKIELFSKNQLYFGLNWIIMDYYGT